MKLGAFFIEILPLLAFFVGYQYFGLLMAAALSAALGAGVLLLARWRDGRIAAFPLFSVVMSGLFTAIAWGLDDGIKFPPKNFCRKISAEML